jgi:hypothetical protein
MGKRRGGCSWVAEAELSGADMARWSSLPHQWSALLQIHGGGVDKVRVELTASPMERTATDPVT